MSKANSVFSRIADTLNISSSVEPSTSIPRLGSGSSGEKSTNEELKGKFMSFMNNVRYGLGSKLIGKTFNKESAIWVLGRCYHQKTSPGSSLENSVMMEETRIRPIDNKLMSMSLHEEMPTSSESYHNFDAVPSSLSNSPSDIERAIEPAEEVGKDVAYEYEEPMDKFKKDFVTKIWMTYRRDFDVMQSDMKSSLASLTNFGNTNNTVAYTSDCGWGCMIRSGQMMLAQALVVHFLGRSWRYDQDSQIITTEDHIHRKIIRWFGDKKSKTCPFSIHKMVELGKQNGKKIGEWYGPGSVAHVLKEAVKEASKEHIDLASLHVYVAIDCTIYNQDILDECYSQENQTVPWQKGDVNQSPSKRNSNKLITTWKHLILLIPLRLGQEKLNPIYGECIKTMLSLEWSLGIIGGRPKHSLYFIGFQDDKLIHLDPHFCQDNIDVNKENFPLNSFHCRSARKMKLSKMDPSCCLGFYIPSRSEYERFQKEVYSILQPVNNYNKRQQKSEFAGPYCIYPMFIFRDGRLSEERNKANRIKASSLSRLSKASDFDEVENELEDDDGIEDFVII